MPELPEVETVRSGLAELITGKTIDHVLIRWPKIVTNDRLEFESLVKGATFLGIDRRGKYLLFRLDNGYTMVSHLRMEGKYRVTPKNNEEQINDKHAHVLFYLTNGEVLIYLDVRKFGRMTLVPNGQENTLSGLKTLGPEPTEEDFKFPPFYTALQSKKTAIKPLLLNQKVVTGLGNIYVDEVLWASKIHPLYPANEISKAKVKHLHDATIEEMKVAIAAKGTTIRSYTDSFGDSGGFQFSLNVYGQTGKPCPRCQTPIKKIKVDGRGTHFCPYCQKGPR